MACLAASTWLTINLARLFLDASAALQFHAYIHVPGSSLPVHPITSCECPHVKNIVCIVTAHAARCSDALALASGHASASRQHWVLLLHIKHWSPRTGHRHLCQVHRSEHHQLPAAQLWPDSRCASTSHSMGFQLRMIRTSHALLQITISIHAGAVSTSHSLDARAPHSHAAAALHQMTSPAASFSTTNSAMLACMPAWAMLSSSTLQCS